MKFIYFTDKENIESIKTNGVTPQNSICGYDQGVYFAPNIDIDLSGKEDLNSEQSWNLICRMEEDRDIDNSIAIHFELCDTDFPVFLKSDLNKSVATGLAEKLELGNQHSIEYVANKKFSSVLKGINNHDFVIEAKFKINSISDLKSFFLMYKEAGGKPHSANSFFLWTLKNIEKDKIIGFKELKNDT